MPNLSEIRKSARKQTVKLTSGQSLDLKQGPRIIPAGTHVGSDTSKETEKKNPSSTASQSGGNTVSPLLNQEAHFVGSYEKLRTPSEPQVHPLLDRGAYFIKNHDELSTIPFTGTLPYYPGASLHSFEPGTVRVPIPKKERKGTSLDSGVKSALFGLAEGFVGEGILNGLHNAGMKYLFDYDDSEDDYEKYKRTAITGNPNNEYSTTEKVINFLGQIGGNAAMYHAGNKVVDGAAHLIGNSLSGTKVGTSFKNNPLVKVLSDSKVINNPYTKNVLSGQIVDTMIQTPRVLGEGIRDNKKPAEIALDVAKQQGSDLLWNLGFEAVGALPDAVKGTKKLIDDASVRRVQKAINEDSMRGILEDAPGKAAKNLVSPKGIFSDETTLALRKIQAIADKSGKDFSEIAGAVHQGKTMKEIQPQLQDFANWVKSMDSPGYIRRIDFDDMGGIRIERGVKETFSMNLDDLKGVRSIADKKSVFYFDDSELEATKKWADKFWNDLGNKSPYYRAANGDWRATSKEPISITDVKYQPDYDIKKVPRRTFQNQDTGWKITVGSHGIGDTVSYARGKKYSISSLDKIDELIEKSILFDTVVSQKNKLKKSEYTAFMHKFYAPVNMDGEFQIAKITVEESVQVGAKDTYQKFYNLRNIEISPVNSGNYILLKDYVTRHITDDTTISIADLYEIVKKTDKDFYLNAEKLAKQSDSILKTVAEIPSGKNSFLSEDLRKLSDREIEAVIKEENLPFRNAKDVRQCAAFVDKIVRTPSGHSLIALDSPAAKAKREKILSDFRGKALDWLEDNMVDRYSVVKIFDRVDSSTSTDTLLQMYLQSGSTSEYIKKVKFVDMDGIEIGKSLDEIFYGIRKKDRRAFDEYLFHKYNVERWDNGVPLEADYTRVQSLRAFTELEKLHPEFLKVSEELYAFNNYLNYEYGVRTGIISESWFDNATKAYPSYVPTFREYGGAVDNTMGAEKLGHGVSKIFRSAEGRHETVYDVKKLFENKIDIMVHTARKQQLQADMVRKVLKNPNKLSGVGEILDAVKQSKSAVAEISVGESDLISNLKKMFLGNVGGQFTMSAYIDGKFETIGINKRLYNAFSYVTAGGSQTLKVGAQKFFDFYGKHVTGNFKKVVTALNPLYAGSNFFRDIPNALTSTTGSMGEMVKHYPEAFYKILKRDDTFRQFCALGGADTGLMENVGKALARRNYNLIDGIARWNGFTEAIPRYSEYLISLKNGDDIYTALKNAADVTVDFSRGGRLAKNIDKFFVPYFNARLQGFYHSVKVSKNAPVKTIGRAATAITIPTVLLYVANHDNPHYQDLTERQKSYYFNIPLLNTADVNGNPTKFLKIPKTDQFGFLFGTMLEKGLRAASGDEEAFDHFWHDLSDGFLPFNTRNFKENFYSAGWRAIVDHMILGKNDIKDFAGRDVIYENMQDLPPEQQYDESTSSIGIWIGKSIGVSPKVIDYLIKSYTGIVGEVVLPYFQPNIENKVLQPISKRFVADSLYNNDISDTWYNFREEMKTRRDEAKNAGNYREYYKYAGYANDLWERHEQAKNTKTLIDGLVAGGASKNSEAVRILRNQYLDQYKKVINKYKDIMKGE